MMHMISLVVLAAGMVIAVWSDLKMQKIPNVLSVALLAAGIVINLFEPNGLKRAAIGAICGFAIGFLFWLLGVFKAGDAKLIAAIGAMMGWRWMLNALCWAILAGMVIGFVVLVRKRELFSRIRRVWEYGKGLILTHKFSTYKPQEGTKGELPFAVPLAIGCLLAECITLF